MSEVIYEGANPTPCTIPRNLDVLAPGRRTGRGLSYSPLGYLNADYPSLQRLLMPGCHLCRDSIDPLDDERNSSIRWIARDLMGTRRN